MKKKDDPAQDDFKIELDPESELEIARVHKSLSQKSEATLKQKFNDQVHQESEGDSVILRALAWKSESSLLELILFGVSALLLVILGAWAFGEFKAGTPQNLFLIFPFGFLMRPFLVLLSLTVLIGATALRLKVHALYLLLGHGIVLSNPRGKLMARVENRIYDLRILNKVLACATCIAAIIFGFSILGWEAAISTLGGAKGAAIFYFVFGMILYFSTSRIFEIKQE